MMRRHEAMVNLVREMDRQGKVVAAICHAGWMLASAKILQGRTVTSFFAIKDDLIHAGATWIDREVVEDGRLITSRTRTTCPCSCVLWCGLCGGLNRAPRADRWQKALRHL